MDDLSPARDHTVPSVVAGSRAYGLATEEIDAWRGSPTRDLNVALDGSELPGRRSAGPAPRDLVVGARLGCPVRVGRPHVNSRS
jgi:hypothetical protein